MGPGGAETGGAAMTLDFDRDCLAEGRIRPLQTLTERSREAARFRTLAQTRMAAARILLGTEAEGLVVGHAAFAMEFKANELLALAGWLSKSHVCSQVALSRLLGRVDLAAALSKAYADRQVYDYTIDPGLLQSAGSLRQMVAYAEAFMAKVDLAIAGLPR